MTDRFYVITLLRIIKLSYYFLLYYFLALKYLQISLSSTPFDFYTGEEI